EEARVSYLSRDEPLAVDVRRARPDADGAQAGGGGSGGLFADLHLLEAGLGDHELPDLLALAVLLVLADLEEAGNGNAVAFAVGGGQAVPVDAADPAGRKGVALAVLGVDGQGEGAELASGLVEVPLDGV